MPDIESLEPKVEFIRGTESQISNLAITDGQFIVSEEGNIYVDIDNERVSIKENDIIAVYEKSPTTASHSVDDYIYYNNKLYRVILAIAIGDAITIGTNVELANDIKVGTKVYISGLPESTGGIQAVDVGYDNTESGLSADNIQEAIDELKSDLDVIQPSTYANKNLTNIEDTTTAQLQYYSRIVGEHLKGSNGVQYKVGSIYITFTRENNVSYIHTSIDGDTWTKQAMNIETDFYAPECLCGTTVNNVTTYVMLSEDSPSSYNIYYSTDLTTWTKANMLPNTGSDYVNGYDMTSPEHTPFMYSNNNKIYLAAEIWYYNEQTDPVGLISTTNGADWTVETSNFLEVVTSIAYNSIILTDGNITRADLYYTSNGTTWSKLGWQKPSSEELRDIIKYNNAYYFITTEVNSDEECFVYKSTDLTTFTKIVESRDVFTSSHISEKYDIYSVNYYSTPCITIDGKLLVPFSFNLEDSTSTIVHGMSVVTDFESADATYEWVEVVTIYDYPSGYGMSGLDRYLIAKELITDLPSIYCVWGVMSNPLYGEETCEYAKLVQLSPFTNEVSKALDELDIDSGSSGSSSADNVSYDNTDSGLTADNIQDAVDELSSTKANGQGLTFSVDSNGILNVTYIQEGFKFAFHYSETDSDPDSVDYPSGYDNSNWSSDTAYMDYTNDTFHYGNWDPSGTNADKLSWLFPKPCMLKYDGTVDYYLDPNDYTKKADGTASDIANTSYGGNAMMEWGQEGKKIWWKIIPDASENGFTFCVASYQADEDYDCWNHYDCDNEIKDHFYTPIYFGSLVSNKLRSLSGQANSVSTTRQNEIDYATANNADSKVHWYTEVYSDWLLQGMLTTLITKSLDSQTKIGKGRTNSSNSSAISTGTMNTKGLFWGSTNGTDGVKCWGMENTWGNLYRAIGGLIASTQTIKVKLTPNTHDGTTATSYNLDGTGYTTANTLSGSSGYISHMYATKKSLTPATLSGSESTYYCDRCYTTTSANTYYAFVGGYWNRAAIAGAFYVSLDNAVSRSIANLGASLSYK